MEEAEAPKGVRRYRVYQVVGLVVGVGFLALGAAALLGGGGPIIGGIAIGGGVLCIAASIIAMVRT